MAGSRIRNAFSRTTIFTVGKLLLFVVVGFAGGLVLGVASEEPELLAGHLRGETETVELEPSLAADPSDGSGPELAAGADEPEALASRALPDVAANRVEPEPERTSLAARLGAWASSGGEDEPEAAAVGAVGTAGWAIQVGAFGDSASADRLADQLERKGYPVAVLPASASSSRWRVRVQPIDAEVEARRVAQRIERDERLPTWVLRIDASAGR